MEREDAGKVHQFKNNVLLPDRELLLSKECAAGDRNAQQQLYLQFCDDMLLLCLRYLPEPAEAEEALMDGFLAVFRGIGSFSFRGPGSLKAWVKQVMIHQCLACLRRRPALRPEGLCDAADGPGIDPAALDSLSAKEILRLVQELPDGYRTVFNLYSFEGLSHREIADLLGITEATSKSQLFKAKARLRERLPQYSKIR